MPKIEVQKKDLFKHIGKEYTNDALEEILPCAKAELDGVDEEEGILKIELNDTNRPDLWSTAGLARQISLYEGLSDKEYSFSGDYGNRVVKVDPSIKDVRPYIVAFAVKGRGISDAALKDIIQTQEKLCWNYGRKRRSIAMGVYRSDLFSYPVIYKGADPDKTSFVPLGEEKEMSLRQIISDHPKGQEYGHIVEKEKVFPFLTDADGKVLSFPPVINSAEIGAVVEGDENLFIELTGTDMPSLVLSASIVACDLSDSGFEILPVKIEYPYDTPFGREMVTPYYFQEPAEVEVSYVNKLLGTELTASEMQKALSRMGVSSKEEGGVITIKVPPYRNDFLHPVDVIEDIMMGRGMDSFTPLMPSSFTVGRLTVEEEFARKVKDIMIGLGFQEMMYNYLGSKKDYIDKMNVDGAEYIQIANPMTENYEFVRASILPSLLNSESVSANAVYPHNIFEIGKVAFLEPSDNSGTVTRNNLGFLSAGKDEGYNSVNAVVSAVFYYLNKEYTLKETTDPRFIKGRSAEIYFNGKRAGIFGEVNPEVLENWGIQMPSSACEIDLDVIL